MLAALINDYLQNPSAQTLAALAVGLRDAGKDGRTASADLRAYITVANPTMSDEDVFNTARDMWDGVKIRKVYVGSTRQDRAAERVRKSLLAAMSK